MPSLDSLVRHPEFVSTLSLEERAAILQQCAGLILALASVPIPATAPEMPATPIAEMYLTVEEAATRIRRAPNTLHHWISRGTLNEKTGLRRLQGQPLIEWPVFEQCFVHGLPHKR